MVENLKSEDKEESVKLEKSKEETTDNSQQLNSSTIESKNSFSIWRKNLELKLKSFGKKMQPIISPFKNRIFRYSISFVLISFVVYFYIMFEGHRNEETVRILFFDFPSNLLVPFGLVFAFLAALLLTWDDPIFKKYRTPALYMILLTSIFYALIYSGVDSFLFQLRIADWLTEATGVIVTGLMYVFGLNLVESRWVIIASEPFRITKTFSMFSNSSWALNVLESHRGYTLLIFNSPNGIKNIAIDARCSGIHSLTIFLAIFLLMLFESRKRLKWNWKVVLVTTIGVIGTYLINILRVNVILFVFYFRGWNIAEPIHNYLGYALLIMWIPIYWLFILPRAEKRKELTEKPDSEVSEVDN